MLRPEPFQRFLTCMLAHNHTDKTCDLELINSEPDNCLESWSSPPSVDATTVAKCKPIVDACANRPRNPGFAGGPLSLDACQHLFSVTSAGFERKMIHYPREDCGAAPLTCYLAL